MKMRKLFLYLVMGGLVAVLYTALAPQAEAAGPLDKAGRGLRNILIAPLEIPVAIVNDAKKNPFLGLLRGPITGTVNGITRMVAGVIELITFPIPPFDQPLYDLPLGETVWE